MASKQVTDRKKSAEAVAAAADTHAARVAKSLEGVLSPLVQTGEQMPDVATLVRLLGRWVATTAAEMAAADEAHVHELSDDEPARQARDSAQEALSDELVDLRVWMTGLFGASAVRSLGFAAETPRDATALSSFAGEVVKSLREKTFPSPKREGAQFVPTKEANKIDTLRQALDTALKDVAREAREAQGTLITRNTAMSKYDGAFSRAANGLEGLFLTAGEAELAGRVRPSTRRPGQTEELAPPAEEPKKDE